MYEINRYDQEGPAQGPQDYPQGNYPGSGPQNGWGGYPPPNNGWGNYPPPPQGNWGGYPNGGPVRTAPTKTNGHAVAAFCVAVANLVVFSSLLSFITVPVAVILAIIGLKKKLGGKAFAWIAIAASAVSAFIFALYVSVFVGLWPEVKYFADNSTAIMEEYDRTGRLPERFDKLEKGQYAVFWKMLGFSDFDEFFETFAEVYNRNEESNKYYNDSEEPSDSSESSEETTTVPYDYDHSGEDLVILG